MSNHPTITASQDFQDAFNHFNDRLFNNQLPHCMIIFQRKARNYGYYSPRVWGLDDKKEGTCTQDDGVQCDEISLNPDHLYRGDRETLSTLVHEMTHQQQQHFGKPSRKGYHNRAWSELMDAVGLTPSSTGQPGGKRTGQKVSHYIVEDGPYDRAYKELEAQGYKIRWKDIHAGGLDGPKTPRPKTRYKYSCECDKPVNIWAKSGVEAKCEICDAKFVCETENEGGEDDN